MPDTWKDSEFEHDLAALFEMHKVSGMIAIVDVEGCAAPATMLHADHPAQGEVLKRLARAVRDYVPPCIGKGPRSWVVQTQDEQGEWHFSGAFGNPFGAREMCRDIAGRAKHPERVRVVEREDG